MNRYLLRLAGLLLGFPSGFPSERPWKTPFIPSLVLIYPLEVMLKIFVLSPYPFNIAFSLVRIWKHCFIACYS